MTDSDIDRLLVAGASGGTGREVLRLLAPRPVTVQALTRSPERRQSLRAAGADEVVVGDLFDPGDARRAVEGADAVVSAVGSGARDLLSPGEFVDGRGNRTLLDAAVAEGVAAFVMESALGVGTGPASWLGSVFDAVIGPIQRAKAGAEAAIREAPVRHIILRPGVLTNGRRTDEVRVARPGASLWGAVSRADVAHLLAAAPWTPAAANETFEVVGPCGGGRGDRVAVDWRLPGR
ncbi:SDR family oxidoreductase [Halostella sp. JP-L12]|uniref:NAD(P)-binding oxidoreductase n=1 Tax=Halostella TaxID=1843185 RepID=UPI000EF83306|nr:MULTISPECIES: NAD(P)-binding oxidoreductase [Halostella]NHN46377.1 SDR family oxidoreductase [Halostella sp. JP-L12]